LDLFATLVIMATNLVFLVAVLVLLLPSAAGAAFSRIDSMKATNRTQRSLSGPKLLVSNPLKSGIPLGTMDDDTRPVAAEAKATPKRGLLM